MAVCVPKKVLNNGLEMPTLGMGLGTWQLHVDSTTDEDADEAENLEETVEIALTAGHLHFDTTPPTDESIGKVLKKWLDEGKIRREDLFVVSTLPMMGMWCYSVNEYLRGALQSLQLDYVDLYLIKFPVTGLAAPDPDSPDSDSPRSPTDELLRDAEGNVIFERNNLEPIWKAMENEIKTGRAKSIGICDFSQEQIERILSTCTIEPAVLQIEANIYYQRKELREFCQSKNIAVCAYAPLGSEDITESSSPRDSQNGPPSMAEDDTVQMLGKKYGKTSVQILLRFLLQSDVTVIPKCLNPFDVRTCIKACTFELEPADIKLLESLDKGEAAYEEERTAVLAAELMKGAENHRQE